MEIKPDYALCKALSNLSTANARIGELERECFALAAGICTEGNDGLVGDDGGTPYCKMKARAEAAEKRLEQVLDVVATELNHDQECSCCSEETKRGRFVVATEVFNVLDKN